MKATSLDESRGIMGCWERPIDPVVVLCKILQLGHHLKMHSLHQVDVVPIFE